MGSRDSYKPLLWFGIIGFLATAISAIYLSNQSAFKIEKKVAEAVHVNLSSAGHDDWTEFEVSGRQVSLTGFATSLDEKKAALDAARTALPNNGVDIVYDRIKVSEIVSPYTFNAVRSASGIVLRGHAPKPGDVAAQDKLVNELFEEDVVRQIDLASGVPEGLDWTALTQLAVRQLSRLETGEAQIVDDRLTLSGEVVDIKMHKDILNDISSYDGIADIVLDLESDLDWMMSRQANSIVLYGDMPAGFADMKWPDLSTKGVHLNVVDRAKAEDQTPDWLEVVKTTLPEIATLEDGQIWVERGEVILEGTSDAAFLDRLKNKLDAAPDDIIVRFNINLTGDGDSETEAAPEVHLSEVELQCQSDLSSVLRKQKIFFAINKAEIARSSNTTLEELINILTACGEIRLMVEGHTDISGDRELNIDLSQRRAQAVISYFADQGINVSAFEAIGYGPDRPIADNASPQGRAQNRRIEFKVIGGGK